MSISLTFSKESNKSTLSIYGGSFVLISFSGENKQLVQIANKVICESNISISITYDSHNTLSKVCKYNIKNLFYNYIQ